MDEERITRIGLALVLATLLALAAVVAAEATGFAIFGHADDAELTAKLEAEAAARKSYKPCDVHIRQFEPGERWAKPNKPYECASARIVSMPVAKK